MLQENYALSQVIPCLPAGNKTEIRRGRKGATCHCAGVKVNSAPAGAVHNHEPRRGSSLPIFALRPRAAGGRASRGFQEGLRTLGFAVEKPW